MLHAREDYQSFQDNTDAIQLANLILSFPGVTSEVKNLALRIVNKNSDKIPEDEPVFLIRAQDKTAVETLNFWIKKNRGMANPAIIDLVESQMQKMINWPHKKVADLK